MRTVLIAVVLFSAGCSKRVAFAPPSGASSEYAQGFDAGAQAQRIADASGILKAFSKAHNGLAPSAAYQACIDTIERVGLINVGYHKELDSRKGTK
jgi:hypothetical protein